MRPWLVAFVLGTSASVAGAIGGAATEAPIKAFEMTAARFQYTPDKLEVVQGDKVKIHIVATDAKHGFAVKEFGVKATIPQGGETTVEFVAEKAGTFTFACSEYCGRGHSGMKGTLVVQPRPKP